MGEIHRQLLLGEYGTGDEAPFVISTREPMLYQFKNVRMYKTVFSVVIE